jgi:hypothetical protein
MLYRAFHLLLYCLLIGPLASFTLAEPLPGQAVPQYWGKIFSWRENGLQNPTQGIMFELLHEVTKQLPEYQHHYQAMSLSRGFSDLKQHNNLCMVGMVRNPERRDLHGAVIEGRFFGPTLQPLLQAASAKGDL